jgi:hypothetical protein
MFLASALVQTGKTDARNSSELLDDETTEKQAPRSNHKAETSQGRLGRISGLGVPDK